MPDDFQSLGDILRQPHIAELAARAFGGPPSADAEPGASDQNCARCRDSGFLTRSVPVGHPDFGRPIECPCGLMATKRRLRIWKASQIPHTMSDWTLASWLALPPNAEKGQLVDDLRAWLAGERWLLLVGDVGLGKTGLAIALLLQWMRDGKAGLYMVAPSFLSRIRSTYRPNRDDDLDEDAVLDSAVTAPLLVLDDVGKVRLSDWGQEKLFTLVNERYIAGRRTVITSNFDVDALEEHLWDATWDRIRGASDVVKLTGDSLRGPAS